MLIFHILHYTLYDIDAGIAFTLEKRNIITEFHFNYRE